MQQEFTCPRCGSQNPIGYKFCKNCGERFEYRCARCGAIANPEFKFCTACGMELHGESKQQVEKTKVADQGYVEQRSIEDGLSFIVDTEVRELAKSFLKEVESWDEQRIKINPMSSGIALKVMGRVFSCLWPARKSFTVSYFTRTGKWRDYKVTTADSLEKAERLVNRSFKYKLKVD